jgi:hypothetical protein
MFHPRKTFDRIKILDVLRIHFQMAEAKCPVHLTGSRASSSQAHDLEEGFVILRPAVLPSASGTLKTGIDLDIPPEGAFVWPVMFAAGTDAHRLICEAKVIRDNTEWQGLAHV